MSRFVPLIMMLAIAGCAGGDEPRRQDGEPGERLVLKLLRTGGEPVVSLDLASGRENVVPLSRVAGGDPPHQLALTAGRLVFYGPEGVYVTRLHRPALPRLLGRPWYFVPSATEGRVWFVRTTGGWLRRPTVVEMTTRGAVALRGARAPCRGLSVLAAVEGALICQARRGLRAFDPASGRVLARLPGSFPAATHGTRVAWCDEPCRTVRVTDVRTGRTVRVPPGPGFSFEATYEGAFSPDGALLAMPALTDAGTPLERRRVALIDVGARHARLVPGSRLGGYRQLAWSPKGRRLFFTGGRSRLAWSDDGQRATYLPKIRGTIMDVVATLAANGDLRTRTGVRSVDEDGQGRRS